MTDASPSDMDGSITFGQIASGYSMQPTTEFKNGKYVSRTARFRSYGSMADSFADHAAFVSGQPRYADALKTYQTNRDAHAFARGLQAGHYATNPHYADKLISIIDKHNLTQYDQ